ncbi:MAG: metallophosphoesterase [Anaerolineae bacterium]|nr:metallophosphoesterase [Anaerolineae bacterium]
MKIVHLSDLHFRFHLPGTSPIPRRKSRQVRDLLPRMLAQAASFSPDLGVLTGDLLDFPTIPSYSRQGSPLKELAHQDLNWLAQVLGESGYPWIVIPGNHDPQDLVESIWGKRGECVLGGYRFVCFYDREGEGHVPHRCGAEWVKFRQALEKKDLPQVHLQHFLICPEKNEGYPHTYAEALDLLRCIEEKGNLVRLVLCGHYHPGVKPFWKGRTLFSVVPAFCEEPHRYRTYLLEEDRVVWREEEVILL